MRRFLASLFCLLVLSAVTSAAQSAPAALIDADIKKILQDRVDLYKKSVGIVVGLVNDKGTRVVSYGGTHRENGRPVNADTVYEIGSITIG